LAGSRKAYRRTHWRQSVFGGAASAATRRPPTKGSMAAALRRCCWLHLGGRHPAEPGTDVAGSCPAYLSTTAIYVDAVGEEEPSIAARMCW